MLQTPHPCFTRAFASFTTSLILLLLTVTAYADEGPSEKDLLLEEIWELSASDAAIDGSAYALVNALQIDTTLNEAIRRSLEVKIVDASEEVKPSIKADFLERLSAMSEKDLKKVVKHLKGPVGEALKIQAETATRDPREMQMELARKLPRLLTQTKKIGAISVLLENHFQPAFESQWQVVTTIPSLIAQVMFAWEKKEQAPPEVVNELIDKLEAQKPVIMLTLNQTMVMSSLYTFRNVSSRNIKKADKFLSSKAGSAYLEAQQETELAFFTALTESILKRLDEEVQILNQPDREMPAQVSLQNVGTTACVDLPNSLPCTGLTAIQWVCDGSAAQWIDAQDRKLMSLNNQTCLKVYSDKRTGKEILLLVQSLCDDSRPMEFIERTRDYEAGTFDIYHPNTAKCLTVMGSLESEGTPLRFTNCSRSNDRQTFKRISKQI